MIFGAVIVAVVAIAVAELAFPLYPSPHSLCGLLDERVRVLSQVEEHHRGAVLIVSGEAVAGRDGPWLLEAPYGTTFVLVGLDVPSTVFATPRSREVLRSLKNPQFLLEDRMVPVRMLARVASNVNACFAPGTNLTALAVHVTGPVHVRRRPLPPNSALERTSARQAGRESCTSIERAEAAQL
jgi:hypothetical protein